MRQDLSRLTVKTRGSGLTEFTEAVHQKMVQADINKGLVTLFCRHSSASLLIQENADPDVRADLETFFKRLVSEDTGLYRHTAEGSDDMPAHIRTALTQTQLSIPIDNGRLLLGTWQGIYLFEHRHAPHSREVVVHIIGD